MKKEPKSTKNQILVVCGPPGAGKTTAIQLLRCLLPDLVNLDADSLVRKSQAPLHRSPAIALAYWRSQLPDIAAALTACQQRNLVALSGVFTDTIFWKKLIGHYTPDQIVLVRLDASDATLLGRIRRDEGSDRLIDHDVSTVRESRRLISNVLNTVGLQPNDISTEGVSMAWIAAYLRQLVGGPPSIPLPILRDPMCEDLDQLARCVAGFSDEPDLPTASYQRPRYYLGLDTREDGAEIYIISGEDERAMGKASLTNCELGTAIGLDIWNPLQRGKRLGGFVLDTLLANHRLLGHQSNLLARISDNNIASQRLFASRGFRPQFRTTVHYAQQVEDASTWIRAS